jgi:hypothetical protein
VSSDGNNDGTVIAVRDERTTEPIVTGMMEKWGDRMNVHSRGLFANGGMGDGGVTAPRSRLRASMRFHPWLVWGRSKTPAPQTFLNCAPPVDPLLPLAMWNVAANPPLQRALLLIYPHSIYIKLSCRKASCSSAAQLFPLVNCTACAS